MKQAKPKDTLACLYERHGRDVLGILLRLTNGDRAEAEDLTQETFVAAFQGQKGYSGRVPVRAWLVGIAARRWRDSLRRPRPRTVALIEEPARAPSPTAPHSPPLSRSSPTTSKPPSCWFWRKG
jgi:RNA polymerase sigma factor (sigma-70 family)